MGAHGDAGNTLGATSYRRHQNRSLPSDGGSDLATLYGTGKGVEMGCFIMPATPNGPIDSLVRGVTGIGDACLAPSPR